MCCSLKTSGNGVGSLIIAAHLIFFSTIAVCEAAGEMHYYSSPVGSGTACTRTRPCSLTNGLIKLKAGDTLYLNIGTYKSSINSVPSGTEGNPVTIKALNDGQTIIDGQSARTPCSIDGTAGRKHDINVEGIICKNSSANAFEILSSDRVRVRRVSAANANTGQNAMLFWIYKSTNVLLEDCAAYGTGRKAIDIYESSYVIVRRLWGRNQSWSGVGGAPLGLSLYGSSDNIVENSIFINANATQAVGISVFSATYNAGGSSRNRIYGNVTYNYDLYGFKNDSAQHIHTGNQFKDNVSIDNASGFYQAADNYMSISNMTFAGSTKWDYHIDIISALKPQYDPGFTVASTLKNTSSGCRNVGMKKGGDSLVTLFEHSYNNSYGVRICYSGTSQGKGERCNTLNPAYATDTYGKGAYLMVPAALRGKGENGADIGAQVLYCYQDGILSERPLWPWPMEDRIYRETGVSVTWEDKGGLWRTLDGVYRPIYKKPW